MISLGKAPRIDRYPYAENVAKFSRSLINAVPKIQVKVRDMKRWKFLAFTVVVLFVSLLFAFMLVRAYLGGTQPIVETNTCSVTETTTSSVTDQSVNQPAFAVPEIPLGTLGTVGAVFAGLAFFTLAKRRPIR